MCWTKRIPALEGKIEASFAANALCQKIAKVDGVEPVIATAVVAAIADGRAFRNGRQFAAWVGLVPRQHSSGDKQRLLGITKRGDPYLRMLLIHGARSVVYRAPGKTDSRHRWIAEKQRKLRTTKASVAVADKNARIIWALLAKDEPRTGWRLSEFQRDCRTNAVMAQLVRPALRKPAGQLGRTSQSDEADDVSEGKSANSIRARG